MKKIILLLFLTISTAACLYNTSFATNNYHSIHLKKDSVYICNSNTAYAYHKTDYCSGLNRCTHGVYKVSLYDAINKLGRRACKVCEK